MAKVKSDTMLKAKLLKLAESGAAQPLRGMEADQAGGDCRSVTRDTTKMKHKTMKWTRTPLEKALASLHNLLRRLPPSIQGVVLAEAVGLFQRGRPVEKDERFY